MRTGEKGLTAHRQGSLRLAESLYKQALVESPGDYGVMYMLGVLQHDRMRYHEAFSLLLRAAELSEWRVIEILQRLSLVLGRLLKGEANKRQHELLNEKLAWEVRCRTLTSHESPKVSVMFLAQECADLVTQAIDSVFHQTYPQLELIVIENGASKSARRAIESCLARTPIPVRKISIKRTTDSLAFNEAASLANGEYFAFLREGDYYSSNRISRLVEEIARPDARWGFTLVSTIQDKMDPRLGEDTADFDALMLRQRKLLGMSSNSFSLLTYNALISVSNLFVERAVFQSLHGFGNYLHHYDWDFALRASALYEPLVVNEPLCKCYEPGNKVEGTEKEILEEMQRFLLGHMTEVFSGVDKYTNSLAPQHYANHVLLLSNVLSAGFGWMIPLGILKKFAMDLSKTGIRQPTSNKRTDVQINQQKTALIVLGVHRSGTSALSRVLNLCGAFLPQTLYPAHRNYNERGFWEPEAVIELNERTLRQLGGAWNQFEFDLPVEGEIFETFIEDAVEILTTEYGEQRTILIKDPRICLLAPLWHKALETAGYRATYVVPIRNPLEVAQSLNARGDMTVQEGLRLWLDYMRRIQEFAKTNSDITFIRYADLLDDWRETIQSISKRLELPLDVEKNAEEVDCFLDRSLHHQRAEELALYEQSSFKDIEEIRKLYAACQLRCD